MNIVKKAKEVAEGREIIVLMDFGSHLYGTSTPESDRDYKAVFLPTAEEILLGRVPKSIRADTKTTGEKNAKDDVDFELYSLQYFLKLCLKGETVGIDMLHAPDENLHIKTHLWDYIREKRSEFYTKNLSALVSYSRKQAAKYGIRGSRIADAKMVRDFLYMQNVNKDRLSLLGDVWEELPQGEHIEFVNQNNEVFYQVCGKKLQKTVKLPYCIEILERFIDSYGKRAKLAEKNEGIDFKAVSHAIRFGEQIKEILTLGDISFPLKSAVFLRQIKEGGFSYLKVVAPYLEELLSEVEDLSKNSHLPEKADVKPWEELIINVHKFIVESS